jgi:phospholipid-binding lipoprotein MlaA
MNHHYMKRLFGLLLAAGMLTGCATVNNPQDPLEGFNRAMFNFNDTLDKAALKPAATAYQKVVPTVVQTGVGNFFGNIGDVWTGVNNVLQGKVGDGLSDFMRFAFNSTFGLGGVLDICSEAGIPKHREDFGQTLGKWGVKPGPYIVLPFLGSSTLRDTAALPLDFKADLWQYKYPVRWRNTGSVIRLVDQRAALLDAYNLVEEAAIDRYEFVRDAYLQRRESKINDDGAAQDAESKRSSGDGDDAAPVQKGSDAAVPKAKSDADAVPATPAAPKPADQSSLLEQDDAVSSINPERTGQVALSVEPELKLSVQLVEKEGFLRQ